AQIIQGKIESTDNKAIAYASVLIKSLKDTSNISEYVIAKKGTYKIKLNKNYEGILIEVKSMGFESESYRIEDLQDKIYTINFSLKISTKKIEKVEIIGKKPAFFVRKDTVTYNVVSYLDGTERKVEDVIKKLPGIDVDKRTGEIKYKNKSIETVLLDDDNLFGYNYTIGTKNINVNMLEQVQAIENYSENPLLKGINSEDKVVLNLKLKKRKMDFSGNANLSGGMFNDLIPSLSPDITTLGITKNYKSFTILSYNNVGINNTPFDYFGFSLNPEQVKEQNFYAEKIIPETSFSDILEDRTYINNQYFGSHNFIFRIGKRIKIKSNLYYLNDRISNTEITKNQYFTSNDTFFTYDNKVLQKLPVQYRGDLNIKINTSKTSLLEYNCRVRQENIKTFSSVVSNNNNTFESFLKTDDYFLKQKLLYTHKISTKKVIQISVLKTTDNIKQNLEISPGVIDNSGWEIQNSNIQKHYTEATAVLLGKKRNKYSFSIGGIFNNNNIQTELSEWQNSIPTINSYKNNIKSGVKDFYQSGSYSIDIKKWRFSPAYSINYLIQERNDIISDTVKSKTNFIGKPSLKIKYLINEYSFLLWTAGCDKYADTEKHLFLFPVLIDNRTVISNSFNLELNKIINYGFSYYYNNLYNLLRLKVGINYRKNTGNYFTDVSVNENITRVNYFFLNQDNNNWAFNFNVSKYISFIDSKFDLSSDYSILQYNNIVNNSELRNNINHILNTKLRIGTAFSGFINFTNEFVYNTSKSKSEQGNVFIISSVNNTFNIRLTFSKRFFALITADYFLPDIRKNTNNYFFLDTDITFISKNKKSEFNITGKNLLNKNNYEQIQTSDYYVNVYKTNILQRYIMVTYSYNF
ncbi:MAG: hypothetical protein L3J56_06055, partial [Bacteroidales bacterium]|nr:hypothetical protein [Bacteroidales bacterium]